MVDLATALREMLEDEPAVELVVLFGSRAAGRARPGSDVDLGIVWSPGACVRERDELLNRLERASRASVDAVDIAGAPPLLRMEIARTGVVVVERVAGAWSELRARAMLDWWDFAPYARRMHHAARTRLEARSRGTS